MLSIALFTSLMASYDYPEKLGVLMRYGEVPEPPIPSNKGDWLAFHARYGPQPVWAPRMRFAPAVECHNTDGTVVDVSDKFIEFQPKGGGDTKKLTPHTLLATGRIVIWESDPKCYLLEDVKKGDEVMVGSGTTDPEVGEQAFYVMIRKRPGGKLPPTRKITYLHPYHLMQQAENDYEDKGTLLPEHLRGRAKYLKAPPVVVTEDPPTKKDDKK